MPCPYARFAPANLRLCEEPLCAWITEPANAWTNAGFLLAAVWIWRRARRDARPVAGMIGWLALLTGLGSTAFHATSTLLGQLIDQNAMFLESAFFVALNAARWRDLSRAARRGVYWTVVAGSFALLAWQRTWGIALFTAHVVLFLGLELLVFLRGRERVRYHALAAVGLLFAVSWGVWWLDRLGVVCSPRNHVFNGHGAWHLLGALSFVFWYAHYAQVRFDDAPQAPAPR